VADTLAVNVAGVLADDMHAAEALAGLRARRGLARSRLLRTATSLVDTLTADLTPAARDDESPADVAPGLPDDTAMPVEPSPVGVNGHRRRVDAGGVG
jgi:hypothetical protein